MIVAWRRQVREIKNFNSVRYLLCVAKDFTNDLAIPIFNKINDSELKLNTLLYVESSYCHGE